MKIVELPFSYGTYFIYSYDRKDTEDWNKYCKDMLRWKKTTGTDPVAMSVFKDYQMSGGGDLRREKGGNVFNHTEVIVSPKVVFIQRLHYRNVF